MSDRFVVTFGLAIIHAFNQRRLACLRLTAIHRTSSLPCPNSVLISTMTSSSTLSMFNFRLARSFPVLSSQHSTPSDLGVRWLFDLQLGPSFPSFLQPSLRALQYALDCALRCIARILRESDRHHTSPKKAKKIHSKRYNLGSRPCC